MGFSREIKVEGIILKTTNFKESSLILLALVKGIGKISILAKGAKGQKSRFLGKLNILNCLKMELYKTPSSDIYTLKEVELKKQYLQNESIQKTIYYFCASELLNQLEALGEHSYFNLFINYLDTVQKGSIKPLYIFIRFCLRLFKTMGIELNTINCGNCFKKLDGKTIYYNTLNGIVCCQKNSETIESKLATIMTNIYQLEKIPKDLKVEKKQLQEFIKLVILHLEYHFNKRIKINSIQLLTGK